MAVLEKIRVKMGVFITVLIGLALLSFIIDPATLETAISMFSSKNDVGKVADNSISYQDFQRKVEYYNGLFPSSTDEEQMMLNNKVWEDILRKYVYIPTFQAAGVEVGEEEMLDLMSGENISPLIQNSPLFVGEDGVFDPNMVRQFVQQVLPQDQTGRAAVIWNYLESEVYYNRLSAKYAALMDMTDYQTPAEIAFEKAANNEVNSVQYVMQRLPFVADSSIVVSDQEIRNYYNQHKSEYRRDKEQREFQYVVFQVKPSGEDEMKTREKVVAAYDEFQSTDNLKALLTRKSDVPYSGYYYGEEEMSMLTPQIAQFAAAAEKGQTSEIFREGQQYAAARVVDVKQLPDSIFVKHILLVGEDNAALKAKADSLLNVLNHGGNFQELAKEYSADAENPQVKEVGDLGWLMPNKPNFPATMVPGFEHMISAELNKYEIIEAPYGIHIAVVTDRKNVKERKQVEILAQDIEASDKTYKTYLAEANTLVGKLGAAEASDFKKVAEEAGYVVSTARNVEEGARTISMYKNARELSRWAYEAKIGDISSVLTADTQYYFVACLTQINKRGDIALETVKPQIQRIIADQKTLQKMASELSEKIAGMTSMEEIAAKLGLELKTNESVTFATENAYMEPAFVGAVASAQVGAVSAPVAGNRYVYIFKVVDRKVNETFTDADAELRLGYRSSMKNQRAMDVIKKSVEIEDNRGRFY